MLPFEQAREAVRAVGLGSNREWQEWSRSGERLTNIPSHPDVVYRDTGWISWPDWLGYKEAKRSDSGRKRKGPAHESNGCAAGHKHKRTQPPTNTSSASTTSEPQCPRAPTSTSAGPIREEECGICLKPLALAGATHTLEGCGHRFCASCVAQWADAAPVSSAATRRGFMVTCPYCRHPTRLPTSSSSSSR